MSEKKPLLSISLLTSNRMDTIPRCLDSLKPILEAIPSELIIVDTSNNPEVYACNLKYTDKVEKFEWCNDFAKARNVGLEKAKGEWFLFIDDDEWFLDSNPLIEFFTSGDYKNYGYAYHKIRNYSDTDYREYGDAWLKRLVKLQKDTKFHSKIHEYIAPVVGDGKYLEALIGHTGYIYKSQEDKEAHYERNATLLERMEQEEPDNLRWRTHRIQEYRFIGAWEQLEAYCKNTVEYLHDKKLRCRVEELMQVYLGYMIALNRNKKSAEIKDFYDKYYHTSENTLLSRAYMDFIMAIAGYELGEYATVEKCALAYMKAYEIYQKNPSKYKNEEVQIILNEAFKDKHRSNVGSLLLLAALAVKQSDKITRAYDNIDWNSKDQQLPYNLHIKLIEVLLEIENYDLLTTFLNDGLSCEHTRDTISTTILSWRKRDKAAFAKLLEFVKEIDIWLWYKLYVEVLTKYQLADDEVGNMASVLILETSNVFQIPNVVHRAFENRGIKLEDLYLCLDFETWKSQLAEHFACINIHQLDELKISLENSSLNRDVRFAYFMMLYAEQKLLHTGDCDKDFEFYNEMLYLFSQYTCATYETLYADVIPNMELEQLPHNYQAALWLKIYFEEVEKDIKVALPCLSKVMEAYLQFQEIIKGYLECIKQEMIK